MQLLYLFYFRCAGARVTMSNKSVIGSLILGVVIEIAFITITPMPSHLMETECVEFKFTVLSH